MLEEQNDEAEQPIVSQQPTVSQPEVVQQTIPLDTGSLEITDFYEFFVDPHLVRSFVENSDFALAAIGSAGFPM